MGLLILVLGTLGCWAALLVALMRGVYLIPVQGMAELLKSAARWTLLAGVPISFVLGMGAGQLTGLLPLPARVQNAAMGSLLSMPYYAMLITAGVAGQGARWQRNPGRVSRVFGQLVMLAICGLAALITLGAIGSSAGRYMAS